MSADCAGQGLETPNHKCSVFTTLIFFSLLFWKRQGKSPQKTRISILAEPPNSLGKKGKTLNQARISLKRQSKEKTIRVKFYLVLAKSRQHRQGSRAQAEAVQQPKVLTPAAKRNERKKESGRGLVRRPQSTYQKVVQGKFRMTENRDGPTTTTTCDPSIPLEEFLGPSGPKLETELKMSSGAFRPRELIKLKTESKKSRKMEISTLFQLFQLLFDSVFNFLGVIKGAY